MLPYNWISKGLEIFGIVENIRKLMSDSMRSWKLELTLSGQSLEDVHIQREILQGDSLYPPLFGICMISLTLISRKLAASYKWGQKDFRINHLLVIMDDLRLPRIRTKWIHYNCTFILRKYQDAILSKQVWSASMEERESCEAKSSSTSEWTNDERNWWKSYKYLGIMEMDKIKKRRPWTD